MYIQTEKHTHTHTRLSASDFISVCVCVCHVSQKIQLDIQAELRGITATQHNRKIIIQSDQQWQQRQRQPQHQSPRWNLSRFLQGPAEPFQGSGGGSLSEEPHGDSVAAEPSHHSQVSTGKMAIFPS